MSKNLISPSCSVMHCVGDLGGRGEEKLPGKQPGKRDRGPQGLKRTEKENLEMDPHKWIKQLEVVCIFRVAVSVNESYNNPELFQLDWPSYLWDASQGHPFKEPGAPYAPI